MRKNYVVSFSAKSSAADGANVVKDLNDIAVRYGLELDELQILRLYEDDDDALDRAHNVGVRA